MVLLGSAAHFLVSQNEQALSFLHSHFLVDTQALKSQQPQLSSNVTRKSPLERLSISVLDRFLLSTCLYYFKCCLIPCQNKRRAKLVRYMTAADETVEKTLDVRRLFRIERLLSGLSRIVLDEKHLVRLVKKQRHGHVLQLDDDLPTKKHDDIDSLLNLTESSQSEE